MRHDLCELAQLADQAQMEELAEGRIAALEVRTSSIQRTLMFPRSVRCEQKPLHASLLVCIREQFPSSRAQAKEMPVTRVEPSLQVLRRWRTAFLMSTGLQADINSSRNHSAPDLLKLS